MKRTSGRVIAYTRVSTAEQAVSGLGLADQRAVIDREAERRSWTDMSYVVDEGWSAKNLSRPGIASALADLEAHRAGLLVVAKLDRLSRSLLDFATLMDRSRRQGWQIVVLDLALDTSTPSGALMGNVMASFAEYERQLIGARTSAAMQQLKAQGARLGRPSQTPENIKRRIHSSRESGMTLAAIARELNNAGIPTVRKGSQWHPSTVAAVLKSVELDRLTASISA